MRMPGIRLPLALIAVAAGVSVAVSASPATAEPTNSVLVSLDGRHWTTTVDDFFGSEVIIPGHEYARALTVKNDSDVRAILGVAAFDARSTTEEFLGSLVLGTGVPGRTVADVPLAAAADCAPVLTDTILAPGEVLPMTLTLRMADVEGVAAQSSTAGFRVSISLQEAGAPELAEQCDIARQAPGSTGTPSTVGAPEAVPGTPAYAPAAAGTPVAAASPEGTGTPVPRSIPDDPDAVVESDEQLDTLGLHNAAASPLAPVVAGSALLALAAVLWFVIARRRRQGAPDA
ncbi:MAG: hypothetical protein JWP66_104 [Naasia sp.]|nr:hypothetical protein [Naasia sp.]